MNIYHKKKFFLPQVKFLTSYNKINDNVYKNQVFKKTFILSEKNFLTNYNKINNNAYENEVFKKKKIMHEIITNDKLDIKNIVSKKVLNKLKNIKNILIIGNGSIKKNITNLLNNYDIIVRFNNFKKDNPIDLVGEKIHIHFTCLPEDLKTYKSWLNKDSIIIIPIEINNEIRYNYLKNFEEKNLFIPNAKYRNILINQKTDFTRGFYGLSMMLQIKYKYFLNSNIHLIGFGGPGHHFDKTNTILHGHIYEIEVLKYLKSKKLIVDLND